MEIRGNIMKTARNQSSRIHSWDHLNQLLAANAGKPVKFYRVVGHQIWGRTAIRPNIVHDLSGENMCYTRGPASEFYGSPRGGLEDELALTNYWEAYAHARKHGDVILKGGGPR